MTPQEQQMLQGLADRINGTNLQEKDTDAEQFIQQTLGHNRDALYVMAQTILVQEYALQQAQKQLADARAQLDQARQQQAEPQHATSFLGDLLGRHEEPVRTSTPPPPPQQYGAAPAYGTGSVPAYAAPGYTVPQAGYSVAPQQGGFLRSALQTATGVAAGALAFEGVESLLHGFGHGGGYGFGGGETVVDRPEEIVNNYYGDDAGREHGHDVSDRRDDVSDRSGDNWQSGSGDSDRMHDGSYVTGPDDSGSQSNGNFTNADDLTGTDNDYGNSDDSMLSDDVGDQDSGGSDDGGGDFGGGDDQTF